MADAMAIGTDAVPRRASRSSRLAACIAAALAVGAALLTPIARTSPAPATAAHPVSVIVRVAPGAERSIEQTLARLGGTVKLRLGIIGGFSATLSSAAVEALRHTPGV